MNWLPVIRWWSWTGCDIDGEATSDGDVNGVSIVVSWRRWTFEFNGGRRVA